MVVLTHLTTSFLYPKIKISLLRISVMAHNHEEEAKRNQAVSLEEEEDKLRRAASATPMEGLNALVSEANNDDIIKAFSAFFGAKPGFTPPTANEDGSISLSFPYKGAAEEFCLDQAQKGQSFAIVDAETKTVMGYSNGDGTLYHADGTEFQAGDTLKKSDIALKDFKLPEPGRKFGM